MESSGIEGNIPNMANVSASQWAEILSQATKPEESWNGHSLIALNSEKNVQVFASQVEAKQAGYSKPMKPEQVIKATQKLMLKSADSQAKSKAALALNKFADLSGRAKVQKEASVLAAKLVPDLKTVSSYQLESLGDKIDNITMFAAPNKRSHNQVFFFQSVVGNRQTKSVVKYVDNPALVTSADKFFERMGFTTPDSISLSKDNSFVEDLNEQLESEQESLGTEALSRWGDGKNENSHALFMTVVPGRAANQLDPHEIASVMSSESACRDIGKMLVLDAFFGNWDRVSEEQCNTGNFMFEKTSDGGYRIGLIDHELGVSRETYGKLSDRLDMLLDNSKSQRVINQLYGKMGMKSIDPETKNPLLTEEIVNFGKPFIQQGIEQGARAIFDNFPNKKDYKNFLLEVGLKGEKSIDMSSMLKLYEKMEKLQK